MTRARHAARAAALGLALAVAAPTALAEESTMYAVMVEFDVTPEQTDAVVDTVEGLLSDLVRHQPGFLQARLNRQADGPKVVNYMLWESADAFGRFRAENKERIGEAVGKFGPRFTFYDVARSVDPAR